MKLSPPRAEYLHGEDDDADAEHEPGEDLGELAELDLQRGLTLLGARERVGDLAHLGLHAGGGDDHGAAAVDDGGAHVAHVLAVAEGHIGAVLEVDDVDELVDGDALAGEGGLLYLEAGAVEYAAVGGNGVARLKVDYVAHHELGAGHDAELAVAHDLAGGGGHGLQGLYGLFRLVFLIDAEHALSQSTAMMMMTSAKPSPSGPKTLVMALIAAAAMRMIIIGSAICAKKRFMSESFFSAASSFLPSRSSRFAASPEAQALFAAAYLAQYAFGVLAIVLQHYHPFIT